MTPVINPWWFYLFDTVEKLGVISKVVAGVLAVGGAVYFLIEGLFEQNKIKWNKLYIIMLIISTFLTITVPSKETCYQMAAASLMTPNNLTAAGNTATDIIDYIVDSIDEILNDEEEE
jgi:predicted Co/Zn/Cd cation transporter (cation efflux family)